MRVMLCGRAQLWPLPPLLSPNVNSDLSGSLRSENGSLLHPHQSRVITPSARSLQHTGPNEAVWLGNMPINFAFCTTTFAA